MWTEKIVQFANSLFARGVVLIDPDTGDAYRASGSGGNSGSGADRELVVSTYRCKTAFTGASVGDTITATQVIDVSGATPTTITTIWRNQTTATDLAGAPSAANLELTGSTALTDAQLRASPVPVSGPLQASDIDLGGGVLTAKTQRVTLASDGPIVTGIGSTSDAAAAADGTGNYNIISALKRGLLNWATLLGRIPALVSGRMPVDGSGVTQPVSGPLTDTQLRATAVPVSLTSTPLPTGAATEATLSALNTKVPAQSIPNLLPVDTLGTPGVPRVQATSAAAAGIVLTTTCRRVSMYATQGTWYSLSGTATTTSHYIASGERLDFDVPANTTISVLQETTAGSIRITELT